MQNSIVIIVISLIILSSVSIVDIGKIFMEINAQTGFNQTNQQQQQAQEQSFVNTITINLANPIYDGESILYREIGNIETNVQELQGLEAGTGVFSQVSADDNTLTITFPAQITNTQNTDMEGIIEIDITLGVNSVETKSDELKIYYAGPGFAPDNINEFEVVEGVLEQMSQEEAVLTLLLEQQQ